MWEELDPRYHKRGLYDGLGYVVGEYLREVNLLQLSCIEACVVAHCEMLNHMMEGLVRGLVTVLRADNPHFNEARFRAGIARFARDCHDTPLETQQPRALQPK